DVAVRGEELGGGQAGVELLGQVREPGERQVLHVLAHGLDVGGTGRDAPRPLETLLVVDRDEVLVGDLTDVVDELRHPGGGDDPGTPLEFGGEGEAQLLLVPAHAKRSEEHTSELQSRENLVCRLLLEKKKT